MKGTAPVFLFLAALIFLFPAQALECDFFLVECSPENQCVGCIALVGGGGICLANLFSGDCRCSQFCNSSGMPSCASGGGECFFFF